MKRVLSILVITGFITACNEQDAATKQKLDSLGTKVDTTLEKVWDSTKEKAKELKEKVEDKLESKSDSAENNN